MIARRGAITHNGISRNILGFSPLLVSGRLGVASTLNILIVLFVTIIGLRQDQRAWRVHLVLSEHVDDGTLGVVVQSREQILEKKIIYDRYMISSKISVY